MAVELIKDVFYVGQLVGCNSLQSIIEGDILVPDTKPDIHRILTVEGDIRINKKEVEEDNLALDGNIRFKVLYVSEKGDELLYSIDSSTGFQEDIAIEGLKPEMEVDIRARLEHIDFNLNNERKIGIRAVINLEGRGIEDIAVGLTHDIEGVDNVEILQSEMEFIDRVGSERFNILAHDNLELGDEEEEIKEILKWDAVVLEREVKLMDGRVLILGDVFLEILYKTWEKDSDIQMMRREIPFEHSIDMSHVYADMIYNLSLDIDDIYINVEQNLDGENKSIQIQVTIDSNLLVMERRKRSMVIDAYVPNKSIGLERELVRLNENMGIYSSQIVLRENIDLPPRYPRIDQVYSAMAKGVVLAHDIEGKQITLEGILESTIIYSSGQEKKSIYAYNEEIPFHHHMELGEILEGVDVDMELLVQNIDFHKINEGQLELRINLAIIYQVQRERNIEIITKVEEMEVDMDIQERPSFTVYFFKEGDTLWEIAKRYHTRVESLMESNNIEKVGEVKVGDQIIIEKLYDFSL